MPLYKRKIVSQKNTINKPFTTIKNDNYFKIPAVDDNNNSLNDGRYQKIEKDKFHQKKKLSAEFHKSFNKMNEIENALKKDLKKSNRKISGVSQEKHNGNQIVIGNRSLRSNNNNASSLDKKHFNQSKIDKYQSEVVATKKNKKLLPNVSQDATKELVETAEYEPNKNKKICPNIQFDNNIDITKENYVPSELEESIISLWSQEQIPNTGPPDHLSHYELLLWLREQRNVGLYVCCDMCNKYRYLKDVIDPLELPQKWYCNMNPDKKHNKCADPELELQAWEEDDLIYNKYHAGSIVWARLDGCPWWPAMIDDDPDTEMYYWLNDVYAYVPTFYHVVFFDSEKVSRAWLKLEALHQFKANIENPCFQTSKRNKFKSRINIAKKQAEDALTLSVPDRLKKYSFLARWPGAIKPPKDIVEEKVASEKYKQSDHVKCAGKRNKSKVNIKKNKKKFTQSSFKSLLNEVCSGKPVENSNYISPELLDCDDKLSTAPTEDFSLMMNDLDLLL